jgi:hypothetical protein
VWVLCKNALSFFALVSIVEVQIVSRRFAPKGLWVSLLLEGCGEERLGGS